MTDNSLETQPARLAKAVGPALEIIDEGLAFDEVRLSTRPIRAVYALLQDGFVRMNGVEVDLDRLVDYEAEPWFRVLYTGVEEWYRDHYGADALESGGNPPLEGVVVIRGAPFALHVPMHRGEVEIERKTAWMYFEAGLGDGEDPREWLVSGPNFERLSVDQSTEADADLNLVATSLRAVQHHLLGADQDETQAGLRVSIRSYLEAAARRIRAFRTEELTLAWMDLHMAVEAALKLVIVRATGSHPPWHELKALLKHPGAASVQFDAARLNGWPRFDRKISNRRYGIGYADGLAAINEAYKLGLDLVFACVKTIDPPINSGAGLLLHVAPYLIDDPIMPRRASEAAPQFDNVSK